MYVYINICIYVYIYIYIYKGRPMRVQGAPKGPAYEGPGGPTRARLKMPQGAHMGLACEGSGNPSRAQPLRAHWGPLGPSP